MLALPAACAPPQLACPAGAGRPMLLAQLYFGRGAASDADWARFVDRIVAPALPDGFTVLDGDGAWLNPQTGMTGRERSSVLVVAIEDRPDRRAALERVRAAYRQDFHQQSVGLTIAPVCGDF
ncbi:MAG: DUF3574 domain-containing protein [Rhodospirillales bacterium]|nr:DUF3574 domain-containing protein [Rhodospirillales bacterium]MBN8903068.1 DUF3574 domain-containing protein [Rhodospirillales bacterium]